MCVCVCMYMCIYVYTCKCVTCICVPLCICTYITCNTHIYMCAYICAYAHCAGEASGGACRPRRQHQRPESAPAPRGDGAKRQPGREHPPVEHGHRRARSDRSMAVVDRSTRSDRSMAVEYGHRRARSMAVVDGSTRSDRSMAVVDRTRSIRSIDGIGQPIDGIGQSIDGIGRSIDRRHCWIENDHFRPGRIVPVKRYTIIAHRPRRSGKKAYGLKSTNIPTIWWAMVFFLPSYGPPSSHTQHLRRRVCTRLWRGMRPPQRGTVLRLASDRAVHLRVVWHGLHREGLLTLSLSQPPPPRFGPCLAVSDRFWPFRTVFRPFSDRFWTIWDRVLTGFGPVLTVSEPFRLSLCVQLKSCFLFHVRLSSAHMQRVGGILANRRGHANRPWNMNRSIKRTGEVI